MSKGQSLQSPVVAAGASTQPFPHCETGQLVTTLGKLGLRGTSSPSSLGGSRLCHAPVYSCPLPSFPSTFYRLGLSHLAQQQYGEKLPPGCGERTRPQPYGWGRRIGTWPSAPRTTWPESGRLHQLLHLVTRSSAGPRWSICLPHPCHWSSTWAPHPGSDLKPLVTRRLRVQGLTGAKMEALGSLGTQRVLVFVKQGPRAPVGSSCQHQAALEGRALLPHPLGWALGLFTADGPSLPPQGPSLSLPCAALLSSLQTPLISPLVACDCVPGDIFTLCK